MRRALLFVLAFSLLVSLPLLAQKFSGTIRGTVTDPTGAMVAGAEVSIKNTATGDMRTVMTSSEGEFVATDLPYGFYDVSVKKANFKEYVAKGVELHTASTYSMLATLQLGSATEQLTVEANAVQVETATGSVGNLVEGREVRELPLNGRSFVQLTQLMPGVSPASNYDAKNKGLMSGVDFSVNGNSTTGNLYLVDGVNNNDIGSNRTILIYPSIDAIQEFKILRNSYPPEYGQAMGAVVSLITRSGTNQWHGSAFYSGRNASLNATDFFNTLSGQPKDALVRNDWGYTFGGPIAKDKLFFFWSQEWNHEQRGRLRRAQVPTAAEKAGDFSQLQFAASGKQCENTPQDRLGAGTFTNINQVPVGGMSPAGALLVQLYPDPNIPQNLIQDDCRNWAFSPTAPIRWRQENIRGDYKIAPTWSLMARYTHDDWSQPFPSTLGFWGDDPFPAIESSWVQPGEQATVKLTKLFGSTAVNDFQVSWAANHIAVSRTGLNPGLNNQIVAAVPTSWPLSDKPLGANTGHTLFWGSLGSGTESGTNLWTQGPWRNNEQLMILKDDFSKVVGTHTFKVGFLATNNQKNEEVGQASAAGPQFWGLANWLAPGGNDTSNGVFNTLWDQIYWGGSENQGNPFSQGRWHDYEFYFGDSWKARRNLTIEYGFRWSFLRRPYSGPDQIANFAPRAYDAALGGDPCNGVILTPSQSGACAAFGFAGGIVGDNRSLQENNNHTIAPRLGIAWDPKGDGKMAVRVGVGQFFQRDRVSIWTSLAGNNPFNMNAINSNRPLDRAPCLPANVTSSANCDPTVNAFAGSPSIGAPGIALEETTNLPNTWQWNLTVERELYQNTKFELAYVGNKAIHAQRWNDLNAIPIAERLAFSLDNSNSHRPFGAGSFGLINVAQFAGTGNYHALQSLFRTRVKTLDAQFAYTWSHTLSDTDFTSSGGANAENVLLDPFRPRLNYGNSFINRPHTFTGNIVYGLPALAGHGALVRHTLGGWELTSILSYASGSSLTVFANGGVSGAPGGFSGTGARTDSFRPLRVEGQPCRAPDAGASGTQWLNPNAWTLQGYRLGTTRGLSGWGECAGPGIANTDFSVHKNFKATERVNVQFRLDFFNLFNKTQFLGSANGNGQSFNQNLLGNASPTVDPLTNTVIFDPATNRGVSFGQVGRDKGPREIQYQLRIEF